MSNDNNELQPGYDIELYSGIFKALSNPIRLQIFLFFLDSVGDDNMLSCELRSDGKTPCQFRLAEVLNIAPSTLSHHMKELKNAGLVRMNRTGRTLSISVDPVSKKLLKDFLK